ncbi:hypothetical protein EVAR_66009_1 [Eumeta japonica]|uniref:Uncharacterized protein n=1 Tax=Eumeta variegata TaxID=151549 RepID=A0A4C1ZQR9_EUMVA|nr:hypothetical protein EVAR_66009_1 [Eumeta japonica]
MDNNDLAKTFLKSLESKINERRNVYLISLLHYLHNHDSYHQKKNDYLISNCSKQALTKYTKARTLSNLFPKNQTAPARSHKSLAASTTIQPDKSQDLFDDFQVDNEELTLIEDSLMTGDVSSDNEKKQLLSVSSDFISLEEEEKEIISNGGQTPEET